MKTTNLSTREGAALLVWTALVDAGLLCPQHTLASYQDIAGAIFHCRAEDPSDAALRAFWEELFITSPMQQPLTRWDAESLANWGHSLLTFAAAMYRCDLVDELRETVELLSNHRAFLAHPALCLLWADLADAYKLRIVPRVYARGNALRPVNPDAFECVHVAL